MNRNLYSYRNYGDRQFAFPFLVGALAGGAAIGLTRPRPIVAVGGYPNYAYQPYYPGYGYGYGGYNGYYYRPF